VGQVDPGLARQLRRARHQLDDAARRGAQQQQRALGQHLVEAALEVAQRPGAGKGAQRQAAAGIARAAFEAFFTAASSFCMPIGFSRKSSAPMRVASTAVSIVAWPDIITTGMLSWPLAPHSLSSVMPSVSGIQMSSRTRSGRPASRAARASAAFSASWTSWPSSRRISESSSRIPTSSSTTSIFGMFP
jgi:hypothetical protein